MFSEVGEFVIELVLSIFEFFVLSIGDYNVFVIFKIVFFLFVYDF